MRMRLAGWVLLLLAALLCGCARQQAADAPVMTLTHADAVAADWKSTQPPTTGWTQVTLPDDWSQR